MHLFQNWQKGSVTGIYSTVIDCLNKEVKDITNSINYRYNSLILDFTISIKTSNLTKTSHYTDYQQKLYNEVKRLKETVSKFLTKLAETSLKF